MEQEALTGVVIGCAIRVHRVLGPGFLETVYRNAFAHELRKAGLEVHCEKRIQVRYDGALVGNFFETGLLFNFGAQRLQFRRKSRVYRGREDWTG